MKKIIKNFIAFTFFIFLTISCKDLNDDAIGNGNPGSENQFVAEDGTVYYTGMIGCQNGNYSFDSTKLLEGLLIPNNLTENFDLSEYLPPIGNQGKQGSCTSWATTYYLKSFQERIQSGLLYNPTTIMSPAYTYNQITLGNCQGTSFESTLAILKDKGTTSISEFPYFASSCSNQPSNNQNVIAASNKISSYKYLSGNNMVAEMKTLINNQTPLLISVFLTPQFGKVDSFGLTAYREHTINANQAGSCHAMLVVGYSNSYNAFKVVNSWGQEWGDGGYIWIDYKAFIDVLNPNTNFKVINQAMVVYDL